MQVELSHGEPAVVNDLSLPTTPAPEIINVKARTSSWLMQQHCLQITHRVLPDTTRISHTPLRLGGFGKRGTSSYFNAFWFLVRYYIVPWLTHTNCRWTTAMPVRQPRLPLLAALLASVAGLSDASSTRFHQWFPSSAELFADVSRDCCNATLRALEDAYDSHVNQAWIDMGSVQEPTNLSDAQESYFLHPREDFRSEKAGLSTAGVVLGLLLTLLTVLSPSTTELALLISQRPLLACVVGFGAPGVLQTRVFEYEDPAGLLDPPEGSRQSVSTQVVFGPWFNRLSTLLAITELRHALACGANTATLAVQLSNRAVFSTDSSGNARGG